MKLKQYVRYRMDFDCKWLRYSVLLMGLSFFLRMVYFFGLNRVDAFQAAEWILELILPSLLCIACVILIRYVKWNAPGIYAIIGCVFCLLLISWSFFTANIMRIFFSFLIYAVAGAALLLTAGGYLPGRLLSVSLFTVPLIFRVLLFHGSISGLNGWIVEISTLAIIAALASLPLAFIQMKSRD